MYLKNSGIVCLFVLLSGCGMTGDQVVSEIYGDSGEDGQLYQQLSDLQFKLELLTQQAYCSSDFECRTIGVGTKPCGGLRYYFAYSASSSDVTEITSVAREYDITDNKLDHRIERADRCSIGIDPGAICRDQLCALKY